MKSDLYLHLRKNYWYILIPFLATFITYNHEAIIYSHPMGWELPWEHWMKSYFFPVSVCMLIIGLLTNPHLIKGDSLRITQNQDLLTVPIASAL